MNLKSNKMRVFSSEGILFYLMGPSGVGKDTLINYARKRINGRLPILFAHRYITREIAAGDENHVELSNLEFESRKSLGLFAMDWESHGNYYGIGKEIDLWLECGASVVVNGSREFLPHATKLYPNLHVILISASEQTLYERLTLRGRETKEEILKRIERSKKFLKEIAEIDCTIIDNSKELDSSGMELVEKLIQ